MDEKPTFLRPVLLDIDPPNKELAKTVQWLLDEWWDKNWRWVLGRESPPESKP